MCLAQGVLVFSWWERVKKDDSRDVNEQMIRFFFFNARWKSSWHRPRYWGERLSCPAPAHTHMAHDINKTEHINKTHTHAKLPPLTGQTNSWSLKQDQWGCFLYLCREERIRRRLIRQPFQTHTIEVCWGLLCLLKSKCDTDEWSSVPLWCKQSNRRANSESLHVTQNIWSSKKHFQGL